MAKTIVANWKMNKTNAEAKAFFAEFEKLYTRTGDTVAFCAPFTVLPTVVAACKKNKWVAGAQNFHPAKNGAYTGEISADMLHDVGAHAVIIGHSERRAMFGESDAFVNEKVRAALGGGLVAIMCIGETRAQREGGKTNAVLKKQLIGGLKGVAFGDGGVTQLREGTRSAQGSACPCNLIVAYEPVWAIGTGLTATVEQIRETHAYIRGVLGKLFPQPVPILYGGSVNDKNAREIFAVANVDGALVGGAALDPAKFIQIVNFR